MAKGPSPPPQPDTNTSWITPKKLLGVFCVINMLNYVDRGVIASNGVNGALSSCDDKGICTSGSGIQGDFNLNNFQDGVLSSAFMVGLLVASPIFASLSKSHNHFRLIGVGLSVWTFATAGCGSSFDFWSILICRMLVGVGEASFISLAVPSIDDHAPAAQKTAWLAMFFMCMPTGVALGYVYGGFVGSTFNWRYAFWGEAILMLPFSVLGFVMKPLPLKREFREIASGSGPPESKEVIAVYKTVEGSQSSSAVNNEVISGQESTKASKVDNISKFLKDLKVLLLDKVYIVNVLGYITYNFVLGAYSYWGPKAGYNIYHMVFFQLLGLTGHVITLKDNADLVFGGMTIVCGILGTLAGGIVLDRMDATVSNAFKLLSGATFLGAIFCFSAFFLKDLSGFIILFSVGELLIFATQAPVNYVFLQCVEPSLRPLSIAMSTVALHIFGDVPSPPLFGILQDYINNWRDTILILTAVLFIAAGIWFIGIFIKSVNMSKEDGEKANMEPLLEEQWARTTDSSSEP